MGSGGGFGCMRRVESGTKRRRTTTPRLIWMRILKRQALFRTINKHRELTKSAMYTVDVLRMIKRRAQAAGLPTTTCCHTFRATGITAYLENGGTIENAQAIAAHESPRTTKLYDRTSDEITLDEVERIT
jgi:integrase